MGLGERVESPGKQEASLPGHLNGQSTTVAGENGAGPRASRGDVQEPQESYKPTQELRMKRNEHHLGKHKGFLG